MRATYAGRDADYWYSDAADPLWLSLGVYAAPGEPLTVQIPAAWAGRGLKAQIGAHTDTLWHLDEWQRHPEITRAYTLDSEETLIASAFGGPVYLTVPGGLDLGVGEITLDGGVSMPRFVAGDTDPATFLAQAAQSLTPLAELGSDRFVLTVPTADLAALTDPEGLMALWDDVLDADADLAAISRDRARPERFAMDVQISAGWMHSGYPLMGYDYGAAMVDLPTLGLIGDWGAFHELGHNHQFGPANLPGTTECTVNLWSVYAMEEVIGLDRGLAHSALDPAARQETLDAYLDGGADFWADWSVWTCLETYLQLQETFGWELFMAINAAHLGLPATSRPDTDQERIDELVILSSETAGLDLTGFYLSWGFPLSDHVEAELAHLPPWTDHPLASSSRWSSVSPRPFGGPPGRPPPGGPPPPRPPAPPAPPPPAAGGNPPRRHGGGAPGPRGAWGWWGRPAAPRRPRRAGAGGAGRGRGGPRGARTPPAGASGGGGAGGAAAAGGPRGAPPPTPGRVAPPPAPPPSSGPPRGSAPAPPPPAPPAAPRRTRAGSPRGRRSPADPPVVSVGGRPEARGIAWRLTVVAPSAACSSTTAGSASRVTPQVNRSTAA
ncbi:MAG: hypothetical protein IPO67_10125 [Deltaproteobacteria bacterium]|nr:hypothetical protein [Deltaproteobacteria bacterium]